MQHLTKTKIAAALVIISVTALGNIALWWLGASVVDSAIKSMKSQCGRTYTIEESLYLAGDLFCTTK